MKIYLDNAATTPLDNEVLASMMPYMSEHYGNPSSIHGFGRTTRSAIETARKRIASSLNASTGEIFFTSCGTESNNMAIKCSIEDFGIKHIITSRIEHHCVLDTVEVMGEHGVNVSYVNLKDKGVIDLDHLESLLSSIGEPCLVSLMHANNEIGNLIDLESVSEICEKHKAIFHTDTVQTIAHYQFDLQKLNIHFLAGSGHKFHGPKGIGFIYINNNITIHPFIHGGSQERNMRAGTENLYGIVGLGAAVELAYNNLDEHKAHIEDIRNHMINQLMEIPDIQFNGNYNGSCLYTVLSVSFPKEYTDMLIYNLDIEGIAASSGSACGSGSDKGSHVLEAINATDDRITVRFSFSKFNTREEVDFVVEKLKSMVPASVTN